MKKNEKRLVRNYRKLNRRIMQDRINMNFSKELFRIRIPRKKKWIL